jgi:hypothetical protein
MLKGKSPGEYTVSRRADCARLPGVAIALAMPESQLTA